MESPIATEDMKLALFSTLEQKQIELVQRMQDFGLRLNVEESDNRILCFRFKRNEMHDITYVSSEIYKHFQQRIQIDFDRQPFIVL